MSDSDNATGLVTATEKHPRGVVALRVSTTRAVKPGEVIVLNPEDNPVIQQLLSGEEFDQQYEEIAQAQIVCPPRVARIDVEADFVAKEREEDASVASYEKRQPGTTERSLRRLSPRQRRRANFTIFASALHILHEADRNEPGYEGISARRITDSGLVDNVLAGQKHQINKTCTVMREMVEMEKTATRKRSVREDRQYCYLPKGK
jgi:hypothetical protein